VNHTIIIERLRTPSLKLVAAAGTVNPFGPTLAGLVLLEKSGPTDWELFRFSLNPFSQNLGHLRSAKLDEATHPSKLVADVGIGLDSAPTLLIFKATSDKEIIDSAKAIALTFADLGSTVDRLRKFPGNPWDRISEEIHDGFKSLSESEKPIRSVEPKDIEDYVKIVLNRGNFAEEFAAFRRAWQGSIDFQKSSGNTELANTAMPLKHLDEIISMFIQD
jgi:hypothetical protein